MSKIFFDNNYCFIYETQAFPGVNKVADHVKHDISLVTGFYPGEYTLGQKCENLVIYGTIGKSELLDDLERRGIIELDSIRGKWEVYSFQIVDNPIDGVAHALIIAGSDKRGTIYGLYHLSELLGVSPLVTWNHVLPKKRKNVYLTDTVNIISKEPSVKYRGFFINDEWPAFGNWATKHFGGINARCYERVFELLLRLKGNYLWPAMWRSNFSMDGPGLESARLADELGVVMSTSHHEPCMRSGEEYTLLRGEHSIYGDAWNFRKNEQGVTRFWRDGLLRNKPFENVITMGMRGERDSAILGKEATLEDNISLLRDVLKTQNQLIRETICDDLDQVPRQIVLFTEVEEFFYGNKDVKGLMGDPELEGVTLILSDNNFGYTRTLPTEEMRNHKGGYGMYYHMDMHGGAYSYQWIGSTYLPRVWEQMTQAYDYGVREIWVTNIGDIGTQEYGLSFFLDLAYDIDKWGGQDAGVTVQYTKEWVEKQFGGMLPPSGREIINRMIWDYTGMLAKRKHEIMNSDIYHPLHFGEAENILRLSEELLKTADILKKSIKEEDKSAFISLIYYPVCGTANLMKMWILAGRNKLFASQNRIEANLLAEQIDKCVQTDEALITEYEQVDNGYYEGFGRSEHIGFTNWNEEDNKYPVRHYVYGAKQPRMLISRANDEHYMTGLFWCDKPQVWRDAMRADVSSIEFDLSCGSDMPFEYIIETDCKWMSFSKTSGTVSVRERIILTINRELFSGKVEGTFSVENVGYGKAVIKVEAENRNYIPGVFIENDGYISMDAIHYYRIEDTVKGGFRILSPYGRTGSAIKVFPTTADFLHDMERPYAEYRFWANKAGTYQLCFYLSPTTPVVFEREQYVGYSVNDEAIQIINTVEKPEIPFFLSPQWEREAMDNIKLVKTAVECKEGINKLHFYGMSPAIILEKILLYEISTKLPESYLGPGESCVSGGRVSGGRSC
jgi:hypothetical protein